MELTCPLGNNRTILALGAESAGNFSVYAKGRIYLSDDFGDLDEEENWKKYQKAVLAFLRKNRTRPDAIITDLHPLFRTTLWGQTLAKEFKAESITVQHHIAHIFSAIGDKIIHNTSYILPDTLYGIAMDGTGYGEDEKIWGGEVFKIKMQNGKWKVIERIGQLENQTLIGGDLAVREPARMLISILDKALLPSPCQGEGLGVRSRDDTQRKNTIYRFVKNYYTKNEFELIYNQLKQNFNCLETSSTGRVFDATSVLLGFSQNERKMKHGPTYLLEKNSALPYEDLKPKIIRDKDGMFELDTQYLFAYLLKHLSAKDKRRLAATAQYYIAQGSYEIIRKDAGKKPGADIFLSGGLARNKIIANYLGSKGAYLPKTIPPGDAGLSFGQIFYYLLSR